MKRLSPTSPRTQRGAIVVFSSIWMVAFLTFVALAINIFFLGTTLLQQRDVAEYMALAAVKILTAPASGGSCTGNTNDLARANCVVSKAEYAAGVPALGTSYSRLVERNEMSLSSNGTTPASCSSFDPRSNASFPWCGYTANASGRGYIVLGTYDASTGQFSPAMNGTVGSATAAYVHLNLKNTTSAPLIMPFARLLGGSAQVRMSSKAVAYKSGNMILLAHDPMVQKPGSLQY